MKIVDLLEERWVGHLSKSSLLEVLFWEKIGHIKLFGFLVAKNVVLCFLSFVNGFRGFKTTSFRFSWLLLLFF